MVFRVIGSNHNMTYRLPCFWQLARFRNHKGPIQWGSVRLWWRTREGDLGPRISPPHSAKIFSLSSAPPLSDIPFPWNFRFLLQRKSGATVSMEPILLPLWIISLQGLTSILREKERWLRWRSPYSLQLSAPAAAVALPPPMVLSSGALPPRFARVIGFTLLYVSASLTLHSYSAALDRGVLRSRR